MYTIPTSINIGKQSYAIRKNGDYRMVLDCFNALEDETLTKQERLIACLIIFYSDLNSIDDVMKMNDLETVVSEMFSFFNCGEPEDPNSPKINHKLVDWEADSQLISAAINNVSGKEIRLEQYIHWWTFMGYYLSIKESVFSTVITIRDKIVNGKKMEKYEREFKLKNQKYFNWNARTIDQREADELIKQIWNSGK